MHPLKPLTFFLLATLLCLGPATIPQPANAGTTLCPNGVCDSDQGEADSATYCAQDCCDTIYYDASFCCGNGIGETGEECDDGNLDDGDGCNADCFIEICGNGIVDEGEECDDSNLDDGDGCTAACTRCSLPESTCFAEQTGPGCDDSACADTVCVFSLEAASCCTDQWTAQCALVAELVCTPRCPQCDTDADCGDDRPFCSTDRLCVSFCFPAESNCYADRAAASESGCENTACEDKVCALDPFCCEVQWDGFCVDEASTLCPTCPVSCAPGEFECADGSCIPGGAVCDGVPNCLDGSDEGPVNPDCCIPDCNGRVCGDDGCGGICGSCELGLSCDAAGQCVPDCTPSGPEVCDGVDNDCDGVVDFDVTQYQTGFTSADVPAWTEGGLVSAAADWNAQAAWTTTDVAGIGIAESDTNFTQFIGINNAALAMPPGKVCTWQTTFRVFGNEPTADRFNPGVFRLVLTDDTVPGGTVTGVGGGLQFVNSDDTFRLTSVDDNWGPSPSSIIIGDADGFYDTAGVGNGGPTDWMQLTLQITKNALVTGQFDITAILTDTEGASQNSAEWSYSVDNIGLWNTSLLHPLFNFGQYNNGVSGTRIQINDFTIACECEPVCVPEEEICDGEDNDCDGVVDFDVTQYQTGFTSADVPAWTEDGLVSVADDWNAQAAWTTTDVAGIGIAETGDDFSRMVGVNTAALTMSDGNTCTLRTSFRMAGAYKDANGDVFKFGLTTDDDPGTATTEVGGTLRARTTLDDFRIADQAVSGPEAIVGSISRFYDVSASVSDWMEFTLEITKSVTANEFDVTATLTDLEGANQDSATVSYTVTSAGMYSASTLYAIFQAFSLNNGFDGLEVDDFTIACECEPDCVPEPEICDGLDNDCDGVVDNAIGLNNGAVSLCDDDNFCTSDTCNSELGECQNEPVNCEALDDQCNVGTCDPGTGACFADPVPNSTPCEDGDVCTSETGTAQTPDHCFDGVCTGIPVDCSAEDDQCNVGTCDPMTGACQALPKPLGTPCEDGDVCTSETGTAQTPDYCFDGVCTGVPVDCSDLDNACNTGDCDAMSGACESIPEPLGTVCRVGSGDLCDPDESCTGIPGAACPIDAVAMAGTVCNPGSGDLCDQDELCSGIPRDACPADTIAPSTTVCRPSTTGDETCEPTEYCTGVADAACPPDVVAVAGTACGSPAITVCTNADTCDGAGICLPNNIPCGRLTAGECPFDHSSKGMCVNADGDLTGAACDVDGLVACPPGDTCVDTSQFRVILTPDVTLWPAYKIPATNPGQFFYNLIVNGDPGETVEVTMNIPYPWVPRGARPLHHHDAYSVVGACIDAAGYISGESCVTDEDCGGGGAVCDAECFAPGEALGSYDVAWSIEDWVNGLANRTGEGWSLSCNSVCGPDGSGFCTLTVQVPIPASGQAYLKLHLDFALGDVFVDANPCNDGSVDRYDWTGALSPWGSSDALVDTAEDNGPVGLSDCREFEFSHTSDGQELHDHTQNLNMFKRIAGGFGRVHAGTACGEDGLVGLRVRLVRNGQLIRSATTDEDGYYALLHKHKGKPAFYSVEVWSEHGINQLATHQVELQGNGWVEVNFETCDLATWSSTSQYGSGRNSNDGGGDGGDGSGKDKDNPNKGPKK